VRSYLQNSLLLTFFIFKSAFNKFERLLLIEILCVCDVGDKNITLENLNPSQEVKDE